MFKKIFAGTSIFVILVLGFSLLGLTQNASAQVAGAIVLNGQGDCNPNQDDKVEDPGDSSTYEAPEGYIITRVDIKAGSAQSTDGEQCTTFTSDGNDGCYSVSGIGTNQVSVDRVGTGTDCKEISHYEIEYGEAPTETPTNTPVPTDTPTPTPTPSPTPDHECNQSYIGGKVASVIKDHPCDPPTGTPEPTATEPRRPPRRTPTGTPPPQETGGVSVTPVLAFTGLLVSFGLLVFVVRLMFFRRQG